MLDFPASPAVGDRYLSYLFDGTAWSPGYSEAKLGRRNLFINGNFWINQRTVLGSPVAVPATGQRTIDRWFISPQSAGSITGMGLTVQLLSGNTVIPNTQLNNCLSLVCTAGQAPKWQIWTSLLAPSVNTVAGQRITVSFYVAANKQTLTGLRYSSSIPSAANDWSSFTSGPAGSFDLSALPATGTDATLAWTRVQASFVVPSTAVNGFAINLFFDHVGVAAGNRTINVTGMQCEVGNVATPFENRHYGKMLEDCLWYYQAGAIFYAPAATPFTTNASCSFVMPSTMRSYGTISFNDGTTPGRVNAVPSGSAVVAGGSIYSRPSNIYCGIAVNPGPYVGFSFNFTLDSEPV